MKNWTRNIWHYIVEHFSDVCITFCKGLKKLLENFVGSVFLSPFKEVVDKFVERISVSGA